MTPTMYNSALKIYVFSYNRGRYLQNCLRSIVECAAQFPVTIVDDGSNDKETLSVLARAEESFDVVVAADRDLPISLKTGGLYNNMNFAIQHAYQQGFERVLFIQDDQQIVRGINEADLNCIDRFFKLEPNAFELHPCFLKLKFLPYDCQRMELHASEVAFIRNDIGEERGLARFTAPGIFDVGRFPSLFGAFERGERVNDRKARTRDITMGFYRYPFMMWLPFPESHRGRKRNLYRRLIEKIGRADVYPFDIMTEAEVKTLFDANPNKLPVAEHYLRCPRAPESAYWSTSGGYSNLKAYGGIRLGLASALTYTKKRVYDMAKKIRA